MYKVILFDLDGTLIHFDHHLFMENYLNLLGRMRWRESENRKLILRS